MIRAPRIWRQGDVYVARIDASIAAGASRPGNILYRGEGTGHAHRVVGSDEVVILDGDIPLREVLGLDFEAAANEAPVFVESPARFEIVHEEHARLVLEAGAYVVWRQRRYSPLTTEDPFSQPLVPDDD